MNRILASTTIFNWAHSSPYGHFAIALRGVVSFIAAGVLGASSATAATFFGTGPDAHPVSASADFTASGDTLTVKLTNTTATTLHAGGLFTGLEFSVIGTPTLTSDTGVERSIEGDGTFTDGGSAVDVSWSLVPLGGNMWQLNFNPDAMHAIVGPPTGGNYAAANASVSGNPGHNPFAAEMAVFELNVPGIGAAPLPSVVVKSFLFGTNLHSGVGVLGGPPGGITPGGGPEAIPEPTAGLLMLLGGVLVAARRSR